MPNTRAPLTLILTVIGAGLLGQSCAGTEQSDVPSSEAHQDTVADADHETEAADDTSDSDTTEQSEPEQDQVPCDEQAPHVDADPSCTDICARLDECFSATGPDSNAEIIAQCTATCLQNRRCAHANGCSAEFDAVAMCFVDEPLDAICDGLGITMGGCDEKLAILESCGGYFI